MAAIGCVILALGLSIFMARASPAPAPTPTPTPTPSPSPIATISLCKRTVAGTGGGSSLCAEWLDGHGCGTVWKTVCPKTNWPQGNEVTLKQICDPYVYTCKFSTAAGATTTTAQGITTAAGATTTIAQGITTVAITTPQVVVIANLKEDVKKGATAIIVDNQAAFVKGQTIVIDEGNWNQETATVISMGSLILKNPLIFPHSKTAVVKGIPTTTQAGTTTPGATQTMTPASKYAVGKVQQQVAGVPNHLLMIGLFVSAAIIAIVFRAARREPRRYQEFLLLDSSSDAEGALE